MASAARRGGPWPDLDMVSENIGWEVLMATTGFTDPRRPRVLIEAVEWLVQQATADAFRRAGWDTQTCGGPSGSAGRCPLLDGRTCERVCWADVVVSRLDLHDVRNLDLLHRLAATSPGPPVVIEAPPITFDRCRDRLDGCSLVSYPARLPRLIAAARARVTTMPEPAPPV